MIIRDEIASDTRAVGDVIVAAFKTNAHRSGTERLIMDALRASGATAITLVAVAEDGIVGQVAFSPIAIDDHRSDWHCLGPVAVRPDRQRQGIGTELIETGIARLREIGSAGCIVVGDPAYYPRFGFRRASALHAPNLPAEFLMALPFCGIVPSGTVTFHEAFMAGE